MKIIIGKDFNEMSDIAATHLLALMYQERRVNLSITAGKTPEKIYELLIKKVAGQNFDNVHYYNFDESHPNGNTYGVTMTELKSLYLDPAKVKDSNIHPMTMENYTTWDQRLAKDGGIDLIMMGIGADGHFCANLPGTNVLTDLHTKLLSFTIDGKEVEYATMGAQSVMMSKQLLLIANGTHKAKIIKEALFGPVTDDVPSSILKLHPNLTVILDEDAAALIKDLI